MVLHVVIDCDPGIDDVVAIGLALSLPDIKVEAFTIVDGNTSLSNGMVNIAVALKKFGKTDIPVYRGCASSLLRKEHFPPVVHIHGEAGAGSYIPTGQELYDINVESKSAPEGLVELAKKFSGQLHVIALAPLTNIALAIRLDPQFPQNLASLRIMGGDYGDVVKRLGAEFNFVKDPESADIVLRESVGSCPEVIMIPFDTCVLSTSQCHWEWFDSAIDRQSECGKYFHDMFVPYRNSVPTFTCCDAIAMVGFLLPGAVEGFEEFVSIDGRDCAIKLERHPEPVKTESCPGGQRGCVVLGKRVNSEEAVQGQYRLRIVTRINEDMFKKAIIQTVQFYS